jgi:hypothetical protein
MSQSVIHDVPEDSHPTNSSQSVWNKTNLPHTVVGTGNTLQCGIQKLTPLGLKMRQWSPTPVKGICCFLIAYNSFALIKYEHPQIVISVENPEPLQKIDDYPAMRRTASLDAIYLKGLWPKGTVDYGSNLPLDKATQTPEEWMVDLKR